jgi:formylglycine-generating enzyme required for sulfatase activity
VSWEEAIECCKRLSNHTKREYRLPSEAEWEYACRAGTDTPFHFGPTITTDYANYCGDGSTGGSPSYGPGPSGSYRAKTTPVDQFEVSNAFGLFDMHGNVLEWCQDPWHDSYEGNPPTDGSVWQETPPQSNYRVLRGGSWLFDPRICRSAYRNFPLPDIRNLSLGFRVVVSAPGLSSP